MKKYPPRRRVSRMSSQREWPFELPMSRRGFLIAGASLALAACSDSSHRSSGDVRRAHKGVLDTLLSVQLATNRIGDREVFTQTYEGILPGPILRLRQGELLRIRLFNLLPPDPSDEVVEDINLPHGLHTTNLHTHGLHVSPLCSDDRSVCGDNILIEVHPGESQVYEFPLRPDHPDGTFWYHPHKHGSAAHQFNSGMAGALIIEGPSDDFLRARGVDGDQVFVIQTIRVDETGEVPEPMVVQDFARPPIYALNGQLQPDIRIRPGDVERWRFLNAGSLEHIPLELRDSAGNRHPLHQFACDGITLPRLEETDQLFLASGNRIDVLMKIEQEGTYQLVKPQFDQGFPEGPVPETLLATVVVSGTRRDIPLPTGALPRPLVLSAIPDDELTGARQVVWGIDFSRTPFPIFTMNGLPFDPARVDHQITLGAVEEWTILNPTILDHPFHIHQNAFVVTHVNGDPLDVPKWLDTVNVPRGTPDNPGSVTFRTRFENFHGLSVAHCHMLDHEDLGMMQLVEVVA